MAPVYMFEVADDERNEVLTRTRVTDDDQIELELINPFDIGLVLLTPKQARELARDLNAAVKVASSK